MSTQANHTHSAASWPVQTAKARFSELLNASLTQGPQVVTYHGKEAAVLLPVAEWQRLKSLEPVSLKTLLLDRSNPDLLGLNIPSRKTWKLRKPLAL